MVRVGPKAFYCCSHSISKTVFDNYRKSLIQHCERSELRLHFEWTKVSQNAKNSQYDEFLKI